MICNSMTKNGLPFFISGSVGSCWPLFQQAFAMVDLGRLKC